MIDREKMISGLKEIADYFHECRSNASFGSKAEEHFWELYSTARDALELLKEQEHVHVQKREFAYMWFWCCGSCGVAITEGDKFCRMCGKGVEWDG